MAERKNNWQEQKEDILGLRTPDKDNLYSKKVRLDARRYGEGHTPGWYGMSNWAKQSREERWKDPKVSKACFREKDSKWRSSSQQLSVDQKMRYGSYSMI